MECTTTDWMDNFAKVAHATMTCQICKIYNLQNL